MKKEFEAFVPEIQVMFHNVTDYCSEDFKHLCGGKVYDLWIFAKDCATYYCSAQKMATCHFVSTVPAAWPEDEAMSDELRDLIDSLDLDMTQHNGGIDIFDYSHALDSSIPLSLDEFESRQVTNHKEFDELLEEAVEYLRDHTERYLNLWRKTR